MTYHLSPILTMTETEAIGGENSVWGCRGLFVVFENRVIHFRRACISFMHVKNLIITNENFWETLTKMYGLGAFIKHVPDCENDENCCRVSSYTLTSPQKWRQTSRKAQQSSWTWWYIRREATKVPTDTLNSVCCVCSQYIW